MAAAHNQRVAAPAATVAAPAAKQAEEEQALTVLTVDDHIAQFSEGAMRLPLKEMGIAWLNRNVNGKHAHNLGARVCSVEGLIRFRYTNGVCHRGDPKDPLRLARRTNEIADRDPFLAPVPFGGFIWIWHEESSALVFAGNEVW